LSFFRHAQAHSLSPTKNKLIQPREKEGAQAPSSRRVMGGRHKIVFFDPRLPRSTCGRQEKRHTLDNFVSAVSCTEKAAPLFRNLGVGPRVLTNIGGKKPSCDRSLAGCSKDGTRVYTRFQFAVIASLQPGSDGRRATFSKSCSSNHGPNGLPRGKFCPPRVWRRGWNICSRVNFRPH